MVECFVKEFCLFKEGEEDGVCYNPNPGVKDSKFANLINDGKNFIKDKLLNWVNNEAYKKLRSDFLTTLKGKIDQETSRLQKEVQALDHDRASLENIKTIAEKRIKGCLNIFFI